MLSNSEQCAHVIGATVALGESQRRCEKCGETFVGNSGKLLPTGPLADEPAPPVAEQPIAPEPAPEPPVAEQPIAPEPAPEPPVAEQPIAPEPEPAPPVAEQPTGPLADEPAPPVAEQPIAPEPEPAPDAPIEPTLEPEMADNSELTLERARNEDGTFVADDPATEEDEAWVEPEVK